MAKPYTEDLRERIKDAIEAGHTRPIVSKMFKVGIATIERYMAQWRQTGTLGAKKFGGHKQHKLEPHKEVVARLVKETPDVTLKELRAALAKEKIKVSKSALDRFLNAAGLSYKKNSGGQ